MNNKAKLAAFLLAFAGMLLLVVPSMKAQAPDWGYADTLEHHPIGPGIQYTKIFYRSRPILLWMVSVDLNNPLNKVEQVQSRNQVPDVQRWTVPEFSRNNTYPGHKVCAAFNHDFFAYEQGACIGINVSEGEIPYANGWGRSLLAISEDKTASVFYPQLDAGIILPDQSTITIDYFNSNALAMSGDCILFNRMNSRTLVDGGKYIGIKPLSKWTVNGENIVCQVTGISDTPIQTKPDNYVIYLRGSKVNAVDGKLEVGDEIQIYQHFVKVDSKFGEPLKNIVTAFHGYPSIVYEGKFHEGEYNNFENGREYEISSRTMAGMSEDGKTLYIVVTEMSSRSNGVNCIDIANWMMAHGSWNIVNFDSGGSAAIAVNHEMLNIPGRGSVRPVEDALLAVSIAPESDIVTRYSFVAPHIQPSAISITPLCLLSFNEYDEVLGRDLTGFTYSCEPDDLGWVDDAGAFHAGTRSQSGIITAEKDGLTAKLKVEVRGITGIKAVPDKITIDDIREYPINLIGSRDNETYQLDAAAFEWNISNPECCTVDESGVLRGIKNGGAILTGRLDDVEVVLNVTVEIAASQVVHADFSDMAEWPVSLHSSVTNLRFDPVGLPSGWNDGINMLFDTKSGRSLYLDIRNPITFYGLPDSVSFQMAMSEEMIKEIYLEFSSNTVSDFLNLKLYPGLALDSVYVIPFRKDDVEFSVTDYPIVLENIIVYLKGGIVKPNLSLSWRDLKAYYPNNVDVITPVPQQENNKAWIVTNKDNIYIHYLLEKAGHVQISVWTVDGRQIANHISRNQPSGEHHIQIPFHSLIRGSVYIAHVTINEKMVPLKFVIE